MIDFLQHTVARERMNGAFTKYHLNANWVMPWPFQPVLHHMRFAENHYPHDHPWNFTSHVLVGGYVEEVYLVEPDGSWRMEMVERLPGTSFSVPAEHIHRIVSFPRGDSWTLVMAEPTSRQTCVWRFNEERAKFSPEGQENFRYFGDE